MLTAFSNAVLYVDTPLPIGRIQILNFADRFSPKIIEHGLEIIGTPMFAAVSGEVDKYECVFPYIQHQSATQINIVATAFPQCPPDFSPQINTDIYFAFRSDDRAVQLLHKSLLEFSKNQANFAAVFLFTAIEAATFNLTGENKGNISGRLHRLAQKVKKKNPDSAKIILRLKKQIEDRIVEKRADVAHRGQDVTQTDLLQSYETAVEFFWNYANFKILSIEIGANSSDN